MQSHPEYGQQCHPSLLGNGFKVLGAEQMDSLQSGTCPRSLKWSAEGLSHLAPSVISIAKRVATCNSFCGALNEP